jgi:hypothetical protein
MRRGGNLFRRAFACVEEYAQSNGAIPVNIAWFFGSYSEIRRPRMNIVV